jgi:hypothetical protein
MRPQARIVFAIGIAVFAVIMYRARNLPVFNSGWSTAETRTSTVASHAIPEAPSPWSVDVTTDPVTGQTTTAALTRVTDDQYLVIRQTGEKLEAYIETGVFLETVYNLDSRESKVIYRLDGGPPKHQTWFVGADNDSLFCPGDAQAFVEQLRHSQTLYFRFQPTDEVASTLTFDVSQFPNLFNPLKPSTRGRP